MARVPGFGYKKVAFSQRGLHAWYSDDGLIGVSTFSASSLLHPFALGVVACVSFVLTLAKGLLGLAKLLFAAFFATIFGRFIQRFANGEKGINAATRLDGTETERRADTYMDPLSHRDGSHIAWTYISMAPLHGIDITGLDFTRAKIDKRTRKILCKNGAKA